MHKDRFKKAILSGLCVFSLICSATSFARNVLDTTIWGVTYSGIRNDTPESDVPLDIDFINTKTAFRTIRTYFPQYNGGKVNFIPQFANQNISMLLGLYLFVKEGHPEWAEKNYVTFVAPNLNNPALVGVLIGNEDYPHSFDAAGRPIHLSQAGVDKITNQIKNYLDLSRGKGSPVSTAQTYDFWMANSKDFPEYNTEADKLIASTDFIAVNLYPNWKWNTADANNQPINASTGKVMTVDQAVASTISQYQSIRNRYIGRYPKIKIVMTETGWPTTYAQGKQYAVGLDNQTKYLDKMKQWARDNNVSVFYYSLFDDGDANPSSPFNSNFGLFTSTRGTKTPG